MRRAFVLAALLASAAALRATVTVPVEFREVVRDATIIAVGHVTDVRGFAREDGGIDSVVTVAVDAAIKGNPDRYLSIRMPGGQIGRVRSAMVGVPSFSLGQVAVFFLKPGPDRVLRPIGVTAGVYRVQVDQKNGAAFVDPPLAIGVTAVAGPVTRGAPQRRTMLLKEFVSLTRLVMAGQAAPPKVRGR